MRYLVLLCILADISSAGNYTSVRAGEEEIASLLIVTGYQ